MKASISKSGRLKITPENEAEAYALEMWFSNFEMGDHSSVIEVQHDFALEEGQI